MTDFAQRDRVAQSLAPDERIVWRQKAAAEQLAFGKSIPLVFALLWSSFSWGIAGLTVYAHWFAPETDVNAAAAPWPVLVITGLFSLIGFAFVWATATDFIASWSTHYALTDRRLMIVSRFATESFYCDAFGSSCVTGGPLVGAVAFAWGPVGRRGVGYTSTLVGVRDPHRVVALIRQTLRSVNAD